MHKRLKTTAAKPCQFVANSQIPQCKNQMSDIFTEIFQNMLAFKLMKGLANIIEHYALQFRPYSSVPQ